MNKGWVSNLDFVEFIFMPKGANTRWTSMLFAKFESEFCGLGFECLNSLQQLLLSLFIFLAMILSYLLFRSLWVSVISAILTVLSGPFLAMQFWQATQHDKIAVCLILLTLIFAYKISNANLSVIAQILASSCFLLLYCLAFNSKESSFILIVTVPLLFWMVGSAQLSTSIAILLAPTLYGIWYVLWYFLHLDSSWANHTFRGDLFNNALVLLSSSFNLSGFFGLGRWGSAELNMETAARALFCAGLIAFSIAFTALFRRLKTFGPQVRPFIFMLTLGLCSFGTVAATSHPSSYYMTMFLWAMLICLIIAIKAVFRERKILNLFAIGSLFMSFLVGYSINWMPGGEASRLLATSEKLEEIGRDFFRSGLISDNSKLLLTVSESADCSWYFIHGIRNQVVDSDLIFFLTKNIDSGITIQSRDAADIAYKMHVNAQYHVELFY